MSTLDGTTGAVPMSTRTPARLSRAVIAAVGRAIVIWLAVLVTAGAERPVHLTDALAATVAAAVWLVCLRAASARSPYTLGPWTPASMGALTGLICVAALNPHLPGLRLSLPTLLAMTVGVFLSVGVWDAVLERTVRRRVLVIGATAAADIAQAAAADPRTPFEVIDAQTTPESPMHSLAALDQLAVVVESQRPDVIVLSDDQFCSKALERLLDMTERRFRVAGLTTFYEYAFGRVPVRQMTPMWFLSLLHLRQRPERRPLKRVFEVVAATVGLLFVALLFPLLAVLIKACSPGPVIYRQLRIGAGGRLFTMYKFRTMRVDAERPGPAFAQGHIDPRCTKIGAILRRTHLDELPQLWNVLKGEMSIVGPRPERPEFVEMLEAEVPYWSRRLLAKPGLTGWAQVRCGYASDSATSADKLSYDFWYLRHGNLAVDVAVCFRTLLLMLEILVPRRLLRGRTG